MRSPKNEKTITSLDKEKVGNWPLGNKALPALLFSNEHLHAVMFEYLPQLNNCDAATIRQGLKVHLKRTCQFDIRLGGEDQTSRDRLMAGSFGNIPAARERASEIKFIATESFTRHGRNETRARPLQRVASFAELLWRGYEKAPEMAELWGWIVDSSIRSEALGAGLFLTAESIGKAYFEGKCPVETDSIWLARSVVLFAALLPMRQRGELLEKASELGASPITEAYFQQLGAGLEEANSSARKCDIGIEPYIRRPTLASSPHLPWLDWSASPDVTQEAGALLAAEREMQHFRHAAEASLRIAPSAVIDGPPEAWQAIVVAVNGARIAVARFGQLRESCIDQHRALLDRLASRFGLPVGVVKLGPDMSADAIGTALTELDVIWTALNELDPTPTIVARWRAGLLESPSPEAFRDLLQTAEYHAAEIRAREAFMEETVAYCSKTPLSEVTAFLTALKFRELSVLLTDLIEPPWVLAGAILLRRMLDIGDAGLPEVIMPILSAQLPKRRALLRFASPTLSPFDSDLVFRRLIAVERMRDALDFGPIAQISDPTSGLSAIEIVGPTVHELVDLIISNLDIIENGSDLVHALSAPPQQKEATKRLVDFVRAPATLGRNYRKLREKAREVLLIPLLANEGVDVDQAKMLTNSIALGQSLEDVIAQFESEHPDDRLESRHRDQLDRYLHRARLLLDDFLASKVEPDTRRQNLTTTLQRIAKKLRLVGEFGTIEWLEAELAAMIFGQHTAGDHRTLIGDSTPISAHSWSGEDQEWAMSFVDLAEFHGDISPTPLEVAASLLRWKGKGILPSPRDIVLTLIDREHFGEALRVANDANEEETSILVRNEAQPAVTALIARAEKMNERLDTTRPHPQLDRLSFDSALFRLDIKAAEEVLDFWQLDIDENAEKRDFDPLDPNEAKLRSDLIEYLQCAGVDATKLAKPVSELEATWADVLASRNKERVHLKAVFSALEKYVSIQPDLAASIENFSKASQDPRLWLPEAVSDEFLGLVQDTTPKIANWLSNSRNFRYEERAAVIALTIWYCDFVLESSRALHGQDEKAVLQSGLERILEVAVIVSDAEKPTDCILDLTGSLDTEAVFSQVESPEDQTSLGEIVAMDPERLEVTPLPNEILEMADSPLYGAFLGALKSQDWAAAARLCDEVAQSANAASGERLRGIARAIVPLMDKESLPRSELADRFPSAAAWLFGQFDGATEVSESSRVELAFRLLSGAIAADSEQEMPRAAEVGGSWAKLLDRPSHFRRMLSNGLPSRTGRVLEALLSGALGVAVAERLWDAATNMSEPQSYRTPLLILLSDYGVHDLIIRLAHRYEPTIATRLAQLFDLRAVAQNRPDLLPVAQSLALHIAGDAKSVPFRTFVKGLPSAAQAVKPTLRVVIDGSVQLRESKEGQSYFELPIIVTPEGLVPSKLTATLFAEDDLSFVDGSRLKVLATEPIYFATDFSVNIRFGRSWFATSAVHRDTFRIRVEAKTVTGEIILEDAVCSVRAPDRARGDGRRLDTDTLMDLYPGVANNPVVDKSFVGRIDELERLNQVLVSAKNPSPVLLTGMRRVGKTSLLYAFHQSCRLARNKGAISIYLSLAERKVELASIDHSVARVFFKAISHALVRPYLQTENRNYALCAVIRKQFNDNWRAARLAIEDCFDEESLASSMMVLTERLREWTSSNLRFIFLIDEAEALVAPYQAGGKKKLELEQLLQSLREVSQTTGSVGLLLCGSNHINVFAREYKNAFFGSSQAIELEGFSDVATSSQIIAPRGVENFVEFETAAVEFAWSLCAGMPQFLWQIGATTAFQIRSGSATRSDIRAAVSMLLGLEKSKLPFRPYEILEPIDNLLSMEVPRERDLLWMLLYRVAQASSLSAPDATVPFVIDQTLLSADDRVGWKRRLGTLVDLKVLRMDSGSAVRFRVPLFAEGFRSPKNWQEYNIRQQQVGI